MVCGSNERSPGPESWEIIVEIRYVVPQLDVSRCYRKMMDPVGVFLVFFFKKRNKKRWE